jgi:cellular nucleic acid-binding protein
LAKACAAAKKPDSRDCRVCGQVGHIARNCPSAPAPEPGAAPVGGGGGEDGGKGRRKKRSGTRPVGSKRCFNCGLNGHLSAVGALK